MSYVSITLFVTAFFWQKHQNKILLLLDTHNQLFDNEKVAQMTMKLDTNNIFTNEDISNIKFEQK